MIQLNDSAARRVSIAAKKNAKKKNPTVGATQRRVAGEPNGVARSNKLRMG